MYLTENASQLLWRLIVHQRLKPLLKLIHGHLPTLPVLHAAVDGLGRDEHIAHNMDDAIRCNSILDRHTGEAVDLDLNEAAVASDIDAERLVL